MLASQSLSEHAVRYDSLHKEGNECVYLPPYLPLVYLLRKGDRLEPLRRLFLVLLTNSCCCCRFGYIGHVAPITTTPGKTHTYIYILS